MSGLKEGTNVVTTFIRIKEGKLVVRQPDKTFKEYMSVEGVIKKVFFSTEEYEGKKFEKANFYISNVGELLILQMRTDSGYFRGLCNSLRSSNTPKETVEIKPHLSKADGKPKTTCFVMQNGTTLKHHFTINNAGDLPQLEKHEFKGQTMYDGTKQIEYWKNWLNSVFTETIEEPQTYPPKDSNFVQIEDDFPF